MLVMERTNTKRLTRTSDFTFARAAEAMGMNTHEIRLLDLGCLFAAVQVNWIHYAEKQNCWQRTAGSSALPQCLHAHHHGQQCESLRTQQPASEIDSHIMRIPAAAFPLPLQLQHWCRTVSKYIDLLFFFITTASANKCVFEWSYSRLMDENDHRRYSVGDKADRPPQLIWKTARLLSGWSKVISGARPV